VLGFHAAWRPTVSGGQTPSSVATQAMMDLYPADVRGWIGRHGGLTPHMIYLKGRELAAMVPMCGAAGTVAAAAHEAVGVGRTGREPNAVARANREAQVVRPGQPRAKFAAQQLR
jgi:hypothetical protein